MNTSVSEKIVARAERLTVKRDALVVDLVDGRTISAPLAWYPRLVHATVAERNHWRLIGDGEGMHWPDLDEDVSIKNILLGETSGESQKSFNAWLARRAAAKGAK